MVDGGEARSSEDEYASDVWRTRQCTRVGRDPGDRDRAPRERLEPGRRLGFRAPQRAQRPLLLSLSISFSSSIHTLHNMDGWSKLQSGFAGLNLGQSANKFAKGFSSSVQATRERLGQVAPEEITELPQGAFPPRTVGMPR